MQETEKKNVSASPRLDALLAQGEALIEARRNPAKGREKFPDFGEAYDAWNATGRDLVAELSGQAAAARWGAGWCRAMHALDQSAEQENCLKEQVRQQAMLVELRRRLASSPATAAPATKTQTRDLRNELLLKDLRRVAKLLKTKKLTETEYQRHGRSTPAIVIRRFHGWNNALAAAELEVPFRKRIPALELLENLQRVEKALGRLPRREEMARPASAFTGTPYYKRFGSWPRTLKALAAWKKDGRAPGDPAEWKRPSGAIYRLRYIVFQRDGYKCTVCGKSPVTHPGTVLEVDHIKPRARGGLTTPDNLRTLCRKCNLGKGDL